MRKSATKHLTRRELKREDQIHAVIARTSSLVLGRTPILLIVLGLAVAGTVGVLLWRNYQKSRDARGQRQFGEALEVFHGTVVGGSTSNVSSDHPTTFSSEDEKYRKAWEKFNQISQQYSSRKVGTLARYYAALAQHELKNDKQAIHLLQQVEGTSDAELRAVARSALAEIYRAGHNRDQALQVYQSMLNDRESKFPKDALLANMAQMAEAMGKKSEAANYYQRLTREYAQSVFVVEARARLALLNPAPK
ncbi:MAG: tetratricopeptide repeat protein [Acidobacteria bacterium]|nr:tetratricopeptide repeat protein [Acidobacteriota bacterium]